MSLGGYLYAGCSVQKSDFTDLTDKQWALALHKCRVKAFLDSLARSGATWVCSRTNGEIDMDSTHTGYVHILAPHSGATDDNYQGYATYFKYMDNGAATAYYLIMTVPRWSINSSPGESSDSHAGVDIYADNVVTKRFSGNYNEYMMCHCYRATCFHALSVEDFGTHPKDNEFIPSESTRLIPVGAAVSKYAYEGGSGGGTYFGSITLTENRGYMAISAASFGYVTKANTPDIESFAKENNNAQAQWNITALSPNLISQYINNGDEFGLGMIGLRHSLNLENNSSININNYSERSIGDVLSFPEFLRSDGNLPWGLFSYDNWSNTNMLVKYDGIAAGQSTSQRVYSSFCLYTTNPSGNDVYAKGYVNVEFVACSMQTSTVMETASSGVYLCANSFTGYIGSTSNQTFYAFVGWDASNPSMASTNACPVYVPDVSFPAE